MLFNPWVELTVTNDAQRSGAVGSPKTSLGILYQVFVRKSQLEEPQHAIR